MTEFGTVTRGEGLISWGSPCSRPNIIIQYIKYYWDLYLCPYRLTKSGQIWHGNTCRGGVFLGDQLPPNHNIPDFTCTYTLRESVTRFCMVIKLDERKTLQGQLRMLSRNLFAEDNLLV